MPNYENINRIEKIISRKTICSFFVHQFINFRNVSKHFIEYKCIVCDLELTNNLRVKKHFLGQSLKKLIKLCCLFEKRGFSLKLPNH